MESLTYLGAGGLCIAAIACLSHQKTARLGNSLGLIGVGTGLAATLGAVAQSSGDPAVLAQVLGALGLGGAAGAAVAKRMAITDLPQMVGGRGLGRGLGLGREAGAPRRGARVHVGLV
jgi:NAD(P) transhydrogenase